MSDRLPPIFARTAIKQLFTDSRLGRAHPGLVFDRYLPIWDDRQWTVPDEAKTDPLLKQYVNNHDSEILTEVHERLDGLLPTDHSGRAKWATAAPLAIGLGNDHPLQNGFTLDYTCGVPVIPGSSQKGMCLAWARLMDIDHDTIIRLFGNGGDDNASSGELIFLPAYPVSDPKGLFEWDILNPHLPTYYRSAQAAIEDIVDAMPTDDPIPVKFLVVRKGIEFIFRLLARPGASPNTVEDGLHVLASALTDLGVGSKTAVGYGIFNTSPSEERQLLLRLLYLNADLAPDQTAVEDYMRDEIATPFETTRFWLADTPFLNRFPASGEPAPIDWKDLAHRVRQLAASVERDESGVRPSRTVVHGQAPLQAFFLLGHLWSPWGRHIEILNKGREGWDLVAANEQTQGDAYFQAPRGVPDTPESTSGNIAVYIATSVGEPNWNAVVAVSEHPPVARISLTAPRDLHRQDGAAAARELKLLFTTIAARFPYRENVIICINGPATLAFLAGRAINRNIFRKIHIPYFVGGQYEDGLRLDYSKKSS